MNRVKYFIIFICGLSVPLLGVLFAGSQAKGLQPESGRWCQDIINRKNRLAGSTRANVFLLSGSSTLFGLSARQMSEVYHVPSVNLGVHAGLGLDYILNYGLRAIPANSLVIFPIEYELYEKELNEEALQIQVLCHDRAYFDSMSFSARTRLLLSVNWVDWLRLLRTRIRPDSVKANSYDARTLNAYGDETANLNALRQKGIENRLGALKGRRYLLDPVSIDKIKSFARAIEQRGGHLVVACPNILENVLDQKANQDFFTLRTRLLEEAGITSIGRPGDHVFPPAEVFDTIYHQNEEGVRKSTDKLVGELRGAKLIP